MHYLLTWLSIYFILLMAGTLSVYHWPMRPVKLKTKKEEKNYTLKTNKKKQKKGNIQGKYKVLMLTISHKK